MNADAIVTAILSRMDTNSDGKLSLEEVSTNEQMKTGFSEYDANKDGSIDRAELSAGMKKRMSAMGAGGGGVGRGPGAGAPSN